MAGFLPLQLQDKLLLPTERNAHGWWFFSLPRYANCYDVIIGPRKKVVRAGRNFQWTTNLFDTTPHIFLGVAPSVERSNWGHRWPCGAAASSRRVCFRPIGCISRDMLHFAVLQLCQTIRSWVRFVLPLGRTILSIEHQMSPPSAGRSNWRWSPYKLASSRV